jgi:hypothetical protein
MAHQITPRMMMTKMIPINAPIAPLMAHLFFFQSG